MGHSHRAQLSGTQFTENPCSLRCWGLLSNSSSLDPPWGASCYHGFQAFQHGHEGIISSQSAQNTTTDILQPSGLHSLPAIMTLLSFLSRFAGFFWVSDFGSSFQLSLSNPTTSGCQQYVFSWVCIFFPFFPFCPHPPFFYTFLFLFFELHITSVEPPLFFFKVF